MPNNVRLKSQWKRCTRIIMNPLCTWVNSWKKSKQDCFACLMLPTLLAYGGIASWKNRACLPLAFFPHSPPMAASKTSHSQKFSRRSQHHCKKNKEWMNEWCTRYSSNAPLWWQGWLWAHAMESVDRIGSTVTGSNKQRFSFVMIPILSNLHCKFVTWLGFLFQQGTNLWHLLAVTTQKPKHHQTHHEDLLKQTASNALDWTVKLRKEAQPQLSLDFLPQFHCPMPWALDVAFLEFGGASQES